MIATSLPFADAQITFDFSLRSVVCECSCRVVLTSVFARCGSKVLAESL
mgnify:CR=1 FL=1|jgi:hypothetical protein